MGQHSGAYFKSILSKHNIDLNLNNTIISDIGANVGNSGLELNKTFPNSTLICYEPVKRNFDLLVEKLKNRPNCVLNNYGVGSTAGTFSVGISTSREKNHGLYSLLHPEGNLKEMVEIRTVEQEPKPHLLKIDIEGMEYDFFLNNEQYLERTRVLVYEHLKSNHVNYNNHDLIPELLKSYGFVFDRNEGPHNKFYVRP